MRNVLATLAATVMLAAAHVHAGTLAPVPQIIAAYDRDFMAQLQHSCH